jgi:hypothetical protein
MAFLSTQRKMRTRQSLRQATKGRNRRQLRHKHEAGPGPAQEQTDASTLLPPTLMTPATQEKHNGNASIPAYPRRARAAGGPEDQALYTCSCGCMFEAHVCADVDCPRCGSGQSW